MCNRIFKFEMSNDEKAHSSKSERLVTNLMPIYQKKNLRRTKVNALIHQMFCCCQIKPWNVSDGGSITRPYNSDLSKAKIPVPSIMF